MTDLLRVYGDCWGGEAGAWNTSLQNKYLEYMFDRFLEENFPVEETDAILNIGIGAGYWDRYLSYKVPKGSPRRFLCLTRTARFTCKCCTGERLLISTIGRWDKARGLKSG